LSDRVSPKRRAYRPLLQVLNPRRQRPRSQDQRKVVCILLGEAAGNLTPVRYPGFNSRRRLHFSIENYGELVLTVGPVPIAHPLRTVRRKLEIDLIILAAILAG